MSRTKSACASTCSTTGTEPASCRFGPQTGWLASVPSESGIWHPVFLNDSSIQETKVLRLPVWQDGKAIFADSNRSVPLWRKVKAASGDGPRLWGSWFHGTTIAGVGNILKTGIQPFGMANTDFSDTPAFYMGDNLLMATRWALAKAIATDTDDSLHSITAAILVFGNIQDTRAFPDDYSFVETAEYLGYSSRNFTSHLDPNWIEWTKVCRGKQSNPSLISSIHQTAVIKGPVVGDLRTWEHIPSMLQIAVRQPELTECLARSHLAGIILLESQEVDTADPVSSTAEQPKQQLLASTSTNQGGLWSRVAAAKPVCKSSK